MSEIPAEHFDRYPASHEHEDALEHESQNIGVLISQIWKLNMDGLHDNILSSKQRFQVHVGQNRWITVDVTDYNNRQKDDTLSKSFTIRMGESDTTGPREWIINELFDRKQGVRYQPFFHDYRRAWPEIREPEEFVPPEFGTVDDPTLADLRQTMTDLGICLEELRRGRKSQQHLTEFFFTRLPQENER